MIDVEWRSGGGVGLLVVVAELAVGAVAPAGELGGGGLGAGVVAAGVDGGRAGGQVERGVAVGGEVGFRAEVFGVAVAELAEVVAAPAGEEAVVEQRAGVIEAAGDLDGDVAVEVDRHRPWLVGLGAG